MTKQRDALAKARKWIQNGRNDAYNAMCFNAVGDIITSSFTTEQQAELAKYDRMLALIDAALAEPEAPDVDRIALASTVAEFHPMARRYCDGRISTAAGSFNATVRKLLAAGVALKEPLFARDGMGRAYDGLTDAEAAAAQEDMPRGHAALEAEWRERTAGLVAALKGVVSVADRNTVEFDAARAAIAAFDAGIVEPPSVPDAPHYRLAEIASALRDGLFAWPAADRIAVAEWLERAGGTKP